MTTAHDRSKDRIIVSADEITSELRGRFSEGNTIGIEVEHFLYDLKTGQPALYEQIEQFLRYLFEEDGAKPITEEEFTFSKDGQELAKRKLNLIGVQFQNGMVVCLEPSGAIELTGSVQEDIHGVCHEMDYFYDIAKKAAERTGLGMWNLGVEPNTAPTEMPMMPKARTKIVFEQLTHLGGKATEVAKTITGMQVNINIQPREGDEDFRKKMAVTAALQPIATALFANSPFSSRMCKGRESCRAEVWKDVGEKRPHRAGIPELFFRDDLTLDDYVAHVVEKVKMYALPRQKKLQTGESITAYLPTHGGHFDAFMRGEYIRGQMDCEEDLGQFNPHMIDLHATLSDGLDHMKGIWTETRFATFGGVETRGADTGSRDMNLANAAFWRGLLQDPETLDALYEMVRSDERLSYENVRKYHELVPVHGLKLDEEGVFLDLAREVAAHAEKGLRNLGRNEEIYLTPLQPILETGLTQASHLIATYRERGNCSLAWIFDDPRANVWEPGEKVIRTDYNAKPVMSNGRDRSGAFAGAVAGREPNGKRPAALTSDKDRDPHVDQPLVDRA